MYYYVMHNRHNGEFLIISQDDYKAYDLHSYNKDDNPIFTHIIVFASSYEKCLEYCEEKIGYKE